MKKYLEFYVFLKTLKIMEASKANDVCRPVTDPHIYSRCYLKHVPSTPLHHQATRVRNRDPLCLDNCFDILLRVYRHILHVIYKDNLG